MADIRDTLRKLAVQIRDERNTGANTALRVGSLLLAMINAGADIGELGKIFIRKDMVDFTDFLLKLLGGIEVGIYKAGLSGASIDKEGDAELGSLSTRLRAILAELQVNGDSEFRGNLSSEEFISGFVGGKGWAIMKQEILNALGVPEAKYTAEFDNVIVRGTLRVFEMVISQLLGENDNRIFTAMMEVDHYDPSTGRVYLDTQNGKLYNPFRKDDYIMVQQYNGMPSAENNYYVTKNYELIITEAGCGGLSDGENRLDWVTFKNFTCSMEGGSTALITKGDTFVRVDNATDPERKGIMQIMTVGNTTPYLDVIYGMKTDPDNYLKGRLGNLGGIKHRLFGWLYGFGELLTNLYAIGDFRMRQTGEDIDTKIEMLKGSFSTSYKKLAYDITEEDNYLANATFTEDMAHWISADDIRFVTLDNDALVINRSTVVLKDNFALIEEYDGVDMLHICNSEIRQLNADIRKPGTHKEYKPATGDTTMEEYVEVKDTLYLSIKFLARTSGTLTIGFQGADTSGVNSLPLSTIAVNSSYDRQTVQASGAWDGKGDFVLKYTGDMYVSLLAVTDKALDDYKKEVSTAMEQTASNIRLLGTNINNLKGTVTNLGIDLDAAEEKITIYANKLNTLTGTVTNLGLSLDAANERITLYANKLDTVQGTVTNLGIRMDAAEERITLYATKVGNNESAISALQIKADSITSTVSSVQGDLEQAKKTAAAAAQAAMGKATQAVSDANDAWWKAYYAQQDADKAQSTADSAYSKAVSNATAIAQTDSAVSVLAGRFKSDGTLVNTGGLLVTADKTQLYSEIYDINGKLAKKAEISTSVQYNPSTGKVTSNVKVAADQIVLEGHVTANGNVEITTDGKIVGNGSRFRNSVMNAKIVTVGGIPSSSRPSNPKINDCYYSGSTIYTYQSDGWEILKGVSYNSSTGQWRLTIDPDYASYYYVTGGTSSYPTVVWLPDTGDDNYGTVIRLFAPSTPATRSVVEDFVIVCRKNMDTSDERTIILKEGRYGGYAELTSTPSGWQVKANHLGCNESLAMRLFITGNNSMYFLSMTAMSQSCSLFANLGKVSVSRSKEGVANVTLQSYNPYFFENMICRAYGYKGAYEYFENPLKATVYSVSQNSPTSYTVQVRMSDDASLNDPYQNIAGFYLDVCLAYTVYL